jgi:DNA-binding LacI/PurR family transcriptional regulator/DNA-binding MarR family transcriptional regulator
MPGVNWIASELGVNRKTVVAALRQLEKEGLLINEGQGRRRRIVATSTNSARPMRIGILSYDPLHQIENYFLELLHLLAVAGHTPFFATKSLSELGMDVLRVARIVLQSEADAWIVIAGSREVLSWFVGQSIPVFALFGRRAGLAIAGIGPNKVGTMGAATRKLVELGHRSIVLIVERVRRLPKPGRPELAFLNELQAHGITPSDYHLPDWEPTVDGLHALLDSLFRVTPPTALIVDQSSLFVAVQQFLANHRLLVPQQVSLICTDSDPAFAWCRPAISHFHWETGPVVSRVVRWAGHISQGKPDHGQSYSSAEFIEGGTIGPAPRTLER